jgi:hypothetical protein
MTAEYIGWTRLPGQNWRAAVRAESEKAAWKLLLEFADQLGAKTIDLYVGPSDRDPRSRQRSTPEQKSLFAGDRP